MGADEEEMAIKMRGKIEVTLQRGTRYYRKAKSSTTPGNEEHLRLDRQVTKTVSHDNGRTHYTG